MRKEIVLVFEFDELESNIKERLIEKCDLTPFYEEEARFFLHKKEEELNHIFDGVTINYSGFWCQGDGASFTCDGVNFNKLIAYDDIRNNIKHCKCLSDRAIYNLLSDFMGSIRRIDHHYYHAYSVRSCVEYRGYYNRLGQLLEGYLEEALNEYHQEEANKIYKQLEDLYYDETSEENRIAYLREFEYFGDGDVYGYV